MRNPSGIVVTALSISTVLAVIVATTLAIARNRVQSSAVRVLVLVTIVPALIGTAFVFDWLVVQLNRTQGLHRAYIDPSPVTLLAPAIFGIVVFVVTSRLRNQRPGGSLTHQR
jgi:hypothetical protein